VRSNDLNAEIAEKYTRRNAQRSHFLAAHNQVSSSEYAVEFFDVAHIQVKETMTKLMRTKKDRIRTKTIHMRTCNATTID